MSGEEEGIQGGGLGDDRKPRTHSLPELPLTVPQNVPGRFSIAGWSQGPKRWNGERLREMERMGFQKVKWNPIDENKIGIDQTRKQYPLMFIMKQQLKTINYYRPKITI